ncbi:MAG: phosphoribosylaminoimidazolesuccinocarboxamide synthase [Blastochloris sp.]|nr:phosphoribosylaminoimidazolesuccinocarboxamide synthase [Blastochloris sp.]
MAEPRLIHSGKVRDVYAYGEELLLVASDRLSAFDVILPDLIPGKGIALTQMSRYWFEALSDEMAHHVISFELTDELKETKPEWKGRTTRCRRSEPMPMECVVRGYLAGSGWKDYEQSGSVQGHALPLGMKESDRLPEPLFTPSTKAKEGHDEPLTEEQARRLVGDRDYELLRDRSLWIYRWAHERARERGIIIADTKFEFGRCGAEILLIDELLTPDSSRFWPLDDYEPGRAQASYDKQYVRDYLLGLKDWNRQPPGPSLSAELIAGTQARYGEAYERITGGRVWW